MAAPTTPSTDPRGDPYAALRVPSYRRFLIGNALSNIGRQGLSVAAAWQIYQWTHSPTALGLVGLVHFAPYLVLALPAGHLADRTNRRWLIQSTLTGSAFLSVLLGLVAANPAWVPDWPVWRVLNLALGWTAGLFEDAVARGTHFENPALAVVFLLLGINAAVRTLGMPARASLVPLILPRELLANAVTWSSSTFELTAMAGPALAGFIIHWAGFSTVYLLDAALGLAMVVLFSGVKFREPDLAPEPRTLRTLGAGVGFIWRHKVIFAANNLDMFATLLGGAVALLPIYAEEILHVGSIGLGWLRAAPSIGAVAMAMLLVRLPPMRRPGVMLLWSVAGFGAVILVFGISRWYWLSFLMLVVSGAFDNISVVVRQSLIQLMTPDRLRGRVTSVNQIFIMSSNELGSMRAGAMAGALGPVAATVVGGLGTIAVVLGTVAAFPQLKRLGKLHELKPAE